MSVVTWFSLAGVAFSAGGLAVIIGIGEVQIQANRGASGDLLSDPWFDVGLFLGALAIALALVAISANVSQVRARSEFPDVRSLGHMMARTQGPHVYMRGGMRSPPTTFVRFGLHLVNQEVNRTASLTAYLLWKGPDDPEPGVMQPPATWVPDTQDPMVSYVFLGARQLPDPIVIPPRQSVKGDVFFEIWTFEDESGDLRPGKVNGINFRDHASGQWKTLDAL